MDIGHMVIKGFGKDVLNSIWIIYVLASGLAKKTKKVQDYMNYIMYGNDI